MDVGESDDADAESNENHKALSLTHEQKGSNT
jgi:hypothetical protein